MVGGRPDLPTLTTQEQTAPLSLNDVFSSNYDFKRKSDFEEFSQTFLIIFYGPPKIRLFWQIEQKW